jgi:hypothetical protein
MQRFMAIVARRSRANVAPAVDLITPDPALGTIQPSTFPVKEGRRGIRVALIATLIRLQSPRD